MRHGVHALQRLAPAIAEAHAQLVAQLPRVEEADLPALERMASALAQLRAADSWRDERGQFQEDGTPWRFEVDVHKIEARLIRLLERFGGSPAARVELGAIFSRNLLDEYVAGRYGSEAGNVGEIEAGSDA